MTSKAQVRRRPPDRDAHILAAAARRFWTNGYHRVSMAEIAADVGIGASALYRHFQGKEELLLSVLDEQVRSMEELAARDGAFPAEPAAFALKHREFGVLWEREAGHLPETDRTALRHRLRGLARRVAAGIDDTATADLRSWAILSILASPSHHHTELAPGPFGEILCAAVHAVATAELPDDRAVLPEPTAGGLQPSSRREALLAVAARLFAERGYPAVGLADIGAAAGIAGPSVYNHFASKGDVLAAALHRGNEGLWLGLHHALTRTSDPADALGRLVAHYTEFAIDNPDIVRILVTQLIHLPEDRRRDFRRVQRDYLAEWVALLRRDHPGLSEASARVRVHATISLVNSLSRIDHLRRVPGYAGHTVALARAALDAGTPRTPKS